MAHGMAWVWMAGRPVGVGHSIFYAHFALANGNESEEPEYSHGTWSVANENNFGPRWLAGKWQHLLLLPLLLLLLRQIE